MSRLPLVARHDSADVDWHNSADVVRHESADVARHESADVARSDNISHPAFLKEQKGPNLFF